VALGDVVQQISRNPLTLFAIILTGLQPVRMTRLSLSIAGMKLTVGRSKESWTMPG